MKLALTSIRVRVGFIAIACLVLAGTASGQVTWDANTTTSSPQDGSGTWNTSGTNWWNGTTNVPWPNLTTSSAIFGVGSGAAGTVTVDAVSANGITFNQPGSGSYLLTGGTISLAGTTPTINTATGVTAEIAAVLAGSAGLTKTGTGTLTLSGNNSYTGATNVNAGTLSVSGTTGTAASSTFSARVSGTVNILSGGRVNMSQLVVQNSGGTSTAAMTVAAGGALIQGSAGLENNVGRNGTGVLTVNGGTVSLTSNNTFVGFRLGNGTLALNSGQYSDTGSTVLAGNNGVGSSGTTRGTLTVAGGTATLTRLWVAGGATNASLTEFASGTVSVSGAGVLTVSNTIQVADASRTTGAINVSGGTLTAAGIALLPATFGDTNASASLNLTGGVMYLGSGGITRTGTVGTASVTLAGGTIGASANWTSAVPMTLTNDNGGITVHAADAANVARNITLSGTLSGAGGLTKTGSGTLTLSGNNSYSGGTWINTGVMALGDAGALGTSGTISFGSGTLQFSSSNNTDYSNRFSTAANQAFSIDTNGRDVAFATGLSSSGGSLTKLGTGTLTLSGNNSYTGATNVNAGGLTVSGTAGTSTANFTANANAGASTSLNVASGGRINGFTVGVQTNGAGGSSSMTVAAGGSLVGNGAWIGRNSGTGTLTVDGGTVSFANGSLVGARFSDGRITLNSGRYTDSGTTFLGYTAGVNFTGTSRGTLTVAGGTATLGGLVVAGGVLNNITTEFATGTVNVSGAGVLTISNTIQVADASRSTGTLNVSGGTLNAPGIALVPGTYGDTNSTASLNLTGGIVYLGGGGITKTGANGTSSVTLAGGTLGASADWASAVPMTLANDNGGVTIRAADAGDVARSMTLSGALSGTGGLTKTGGGMLTLSGNNAYSGGTWINSGTVRAGHASALGSGSITLASGATLDLNSFAIANAISSSGGAVVGGSQFTGTTTAASGTTTITNIGGTIDIGAAAVADLSGTIDAAVIVRNTGRGRAMGQIKKNVTVENGGQYDILNAATIDEPASFSFANNGEILIDRTTALALSKSISGTGSLRKSGSSRVTLTGNNSFSGATLVEAGALIVNGTLAGDVVVSGGAMLGGAGVLGKTLFGAGTVSVGNSPGIGDAGSVDPTLGTDWVFEITGTAPTWNAGSSPSVNDVLRLTDATPFLASLTSANMVDVLFDMGGTPVAQGSYLGGFFVDEQTFNLAAALQNGQFRYWVAGQYGDVGQRQQFNVSTEGAPVWYSLLPAYDSGLAASYTTTQQTVNFGSGPVTGTVTQFIIVPEPTAMIIAGIGIAMAGWACLKRRRVLPTQCEGSQSVV